MNTFTKPDKENNTTIHTKSELISEFLDSVCKRGNATKPTRLLLGDFC